MTVVPLEQITLTMAGLAELVEQGPIILTRDGQPLLVVKDVSGSDWKSVSLASNPLPVLTPFSCPRSTSHRWNARDSPERSQASGNPRNLSSG